jgi:hypothetical protein
VSHSTRIGGVALAFAAVAAIAAGCGSASNSATAPKTAATDYLGCLRDNGINVPQTNPSGRPTGFPSGRPSGFPSGRPSGRPSGGPGRQGGGGLFGSTAPSGVDPQAWQKAQQACASLRPSAVPGGGNRNNGANTAYRNCLTEHGVTVSGPIDQLDPKDSKVAAAMQACAVLRPSAQPSAPAN